MAVILGFEPRLLTSKANVLTNYTIRQLNGTGHEIRTHTVERLRLLSLPVGLDLHGALSEIRTQTDILLRHVPLPNWAKRALASRIGFEPMTHCLEGRCSIQLS